MRLQHLLLEIEFCFLVISDICLELGKQLTVTMMIVWQVEWAQVVVPMGRLFYRSDTATHTVIFYTSSRFALSNQITEHYSPSFFHK